MFGACMTIVRIAIIESAQPGGDSIGIIIFDEKESNDSR